MTQIHTSQKITPCLWFDGQAEEAMHYYLSIFKNSSVKNILRFSKAGPGPEGSVLSVTFELNGQEFIGLNGGPAYTFSPAISFFIHCDTQAEVDELWHKLSEGGGKERCGWVWDKFGVSWQIVPTRLGEMLSDPDPEKANRVMHAMLQMDKLDIAIMEKAYNG